ncbi:VOC family protein, partial [Lysinibacillus sp. D4A1_S13]
MCIFGKERNKEIMNISRVDHVAIICSNYEVSKNFYTRILGFKAINEV